MQRESRTSRQASRAGPWTIAALAAAFVVGVSAVAGATVMKYMDLGDLVEKSDVVVRGDVVEMEMVTDDRGTFRHTTIAVDTSYMGGDRETVTIEQWRGRAPGEEITRRIPGDATFERGEEVVVFLREGHSKFDRKDVLYLTGLAQSKWTVRREEDQATVMRDLSELGLVADDKKEGIEKMSNQSRALDSFEATLKSLVYAHRGAGETGGGQ